MKFNIQTLYLFFAGGIAASIGAYIAFTPVQYLIKFGVTETHSPELLSDIRGMGGILMTLGLAILFTAFSQSQQLLGLKLSIIVYSVFFFFRLVGIVFDGVPQDAIILALAIEFIMAILAWGFYKIRFTQENLV